MKRIGPESGGGRLYRRTALVRALLLFVTLFALAAVGQESPTPPESPPEAAAAQPSAAVETNPAPFVRPGQFQPMTLWEMIRAGGTILGIIILLSVIALVMAIYFLATITTNREIPPQFIKRAHNQLRAGDLRGLYQMCEDRDEYIANVLRAGIKMHGHDRYVIQEAMESEGERGAAALWQRISYLNNIGVIAPLLGLLGTVTGMIGAFGSIAFNDSQSKSIVMAYYVAQAMITTAAGLIVAIPALLVYYYLRGRVTKIIAEVEAQATEFVELLARGKAE